MDPSVLVNLMVEMAGLEEELVAVRATLDHHRQREKHLRELQAEYQADTVEAESAGQDAAVRLRMTEGRIRDIEGSLARKKNQLGGVSDDRQFKALQGEIHALAEELDRLETLGLELIEKAGGLDRETEQVRRETGDQKDRGTAEIDTMAAESERAMAAEKEIVQEIERLIGIMPAAEARHVARLRTQYDQAVVRVQSGACGGCFGQLPVQQGLDAEQGRALVRCASCARYVVRRSWK